MRRLLLFDVDGTLIEASGMGRAALAAALRQLFGTAGPIESLRMSGKTDSQIVWQLLSAAGIPAQEIEAGLPRLFAQMTTLAAEMFRPGNGLAPCPGVPALLGALRRQPELVTGLLTGNIAGTAPLKLRAAGIDPAQFPFGAYGSDARERNQLGAIALSRAAAYSGHPFAGQDTLIIGDTPADIACARSCGASVLAVATGRYPAAALAGHQPDYLMEDLRHTEEVLHILAGTG